MLSQESALPGGAYTFLGREELPHSDSANQQQPEASKPHCQVHDTLTWRAPAARKPSRLT